MPRDIQRKHRHPVRPSRVKANQIAADPPRRAQQLRNPRRPDPNLAFADQRLLQLLRLDQVAVDGIIKLLQFMQRVRDQPVLARQFPVHAVHAVARRQTGAQFAGIHRFRQEIIRPADQPLGHVDLVGLRGQKDEIPIGVPRHAPEDLAEIRPRHAGHHPVGNDDIRRRPAANVDRLIGAARFFDAVAPLG